MERYSQTLHECGPGTLEIKGVMFDAKISSDIKEYCQKLKVAISVTIHPLLLLFY